jgi:hypothetical protein
MKAIWEECFGQSYNVLRSEFKTLLPPYMHLRSHYPWPPSSFAEAAARPLAAGASTASKSAGSKTAKVGGHCYIGIEDLKIRAS